MSPAENPPVLTTPASTGDLLRDRTWQAGTLVYRKKGLVALFLWLLWGDFAWSLKERAIGPIGQILLKNLEVSDTMVGLIIGTIPSVLIIVIGPIVSVKSDRFRSSWGRRIPFVSIPTPVIVVALIGIAFTPHLGGMLHAVLGSYSPGAAAATVMTFALFWTMFEIASVVCNTVFTALINDVVPRPLIGRFFGLFRASSLAAGIGFFYWIIGHAETHSTEILIGIALIYGIGFTMMCLKVKEGTYEPPAPLPESSGPRFMTSIRTYIKECYSKPFYLWVFLAMVIGMLAQGPVNSFSIFYAKSVHMDLAFYGKCVGITFMISLVASYPLGWLADRFHPLRVGMAVMAVFAVTMLWAGIFATDADTFAVAFVLHGFMAGCFATGTSALGQYLFPKISFAQFQTAWLTLSAISYAILPPAMGFILDMSGHTYRYTFLVGSSLAAISCVIFFIVYRKFLALGGMKNYVAPE